MTKSFNFHSFTGHLFIQQHPCIISLCLEENPSGWQQNSLFNKVTHSFVYSAHLPVPPSLNPNTQGDTDLWEDSREDPRAAYRNAEPRRIPRPQNQRCPSPTLGIAGVSPLPPPSPCQPSRKSVFRQPGPSNISAMFLNSSFCTVTTATAATAGAPWTSCYPPLIPDSPSGSQQPEKWSHPTCPLPA